MVRDGPAPRTQAKLSLETKKMLMSSSYLINELDRLHREQQSILKRHEKVRQRLRQYNRENADEDEKNNARHRSCQPCACDGGSAESRLRPSYIRSTSVNMQDLHLLLFTDGEIDIDKVLCLYLLTAHSTETLRMPPKTQKVGFKPRQISPLERLITRYKCRKDVFRAFRNLPLFLLEVPIIQPKKVVKRDPRLDGKVIVNVKIMKIIQSVKTALQVTNPELLKKFLYLAHDRSRIENIMMQPKMDAFYKSLHGQNIISCCESFELEPLRAKGVLSFHIDVEPLEELVHLIRNNVLLVPNSKTWMQAGAPASCGASCAETLAESTKSPSNEDPKGKPEAGPSISGISRSDFSLDSDSSLDDDSTTNTMSIKDCILSKAIPLTQSEQHFFLNIEQYTDEEIDKRETMFKTQPRIMKNLQMGFSSMNVAEDAPDLTYDQDMPLMELALLLDQKVKEESEIEYQNYLENLLPEQSESYPPEPAVASLPCPMYDHGVYRVRHTMCKACMKKWTEPLPTPKISKLRKMKMPPIGEASYYSSKSAQRISALIDRQVRKFEMEEEHYKIFGRPQKAKPAREAEDDHTIEIIDLNEMDLAKLRQEIRVAETAKKLKHFFETNPPQAPRLMSNAKY